MDNIVNKIKQLLALAESTHSEHEAAVALRKARLLMDKHQVDAAALDDDATVIGHTASDGMTFNSKTPTSYMSMLAVLVGRLFECRYYIRTTGGWNGKRNAYQHVFVFVGAYPHHEVASYTFEVLARALDADRMAYRPHGVKGKDLAVRRDGYAIGWVEAVESKVEAMVPAEKAPEINYNTGLRKIDDRDQYIKNLLGKRLSHVSPRRARYYGEDSEKGYRKGSNVNLAKGMKPEAPKRLN